MTREPAPRRRRRSRLSTVQDWWPLLREIAALTLGVFILAWQTTLEEQPEAYLVAAGLALIGVPVVGAAQRQIRNGNGKPQPEDEKE